MAKLGAMHRDLKPDNIMIDKDCNIKVIDFGLVEHFDNNNTEFIFERCGTPGYIAPEIFCFKKSDPESAYNDKCDVFSIGCIFFQLLFGYRLFNAKEGHEILKQNRNYSYDDTFNMLVEEIDNTESKINKSGLELLIQMLHEDPAERISAQEALSDEYFMDLDLEVTERIMPSQLVSPFSNKHKLSIDGNVMTSVATQYSANQCLLTVNGNRCLTPPRVQMENSLYMTENGPEESEMETATSSRLTKKQGNTLTAPFKSFNLCAAKFTNGGSPFPSPKSSRFSILKSERKPIIIEAAEVDLKEEKEEEEESELTEEIISGDYSEDFQPMSFLEAYKVPVFTNSSGKMERLNSKNLRFTTLAN